MTNLELRLYEALRELRRRFHMCAVDNKRYVNMATAAADALLRECEAQMKRDAEEVGSE